MAQFYSVTFGALSVYGDGNYGENTYSCSSLSDPACVAQVSSTSGGASTSTLADTGMFVVAFATFACAIVFMALVIRIWRRKPAAEIVPVVQQDDMPATDRDNSRE